MSNASVLSLPTEHLRPINDHKLDPGNLILLDSIPCKRSRATVYDIVNNIDIVNEHDCWKLDFSSCLEDEFRQIWDIIQFEDVISIVLSDVHEAPGQIELFLSLVKLNRFTGLQSLTLYLLKECKFSKFLEHMHLFKLRSLKIRWGGDSDLDETTTNLLSTTIANAPHLKKLHLEIKNYSIEDIPWLENNNSIQYLFLNQCTLNQVIHALRHLRALHTLVLNDIDTTWDDHVFMNLEKFNSLKSLTIKQKYMSINMLESILMHTPELEHLKITGYTRLADDFYDGSRWENFIQKSLTHLEKFEFFFHLAVAEEQAIDDLESTINPFRTNFWLEEKHWNTCCEYITDLYVLKLYSIPICESNFSYECGLNKTCYSTVTNPHSASMMNEVSHLELDSIPNTTFGQNEQATHRLFNNVTKLSLLSVNDWSENSIKYLSTIVDLSHVRTLSWNMTFNPDSLRNFIPFFNNLIQQACNIRVIDIPYPLPNDNAGNNTNIIRSIFPFPDQVKHLKVFIQELIEMEIILEEIILKGCKRSSSVIFWSSRNLYNDYTQIVRRLHKMKIQHEFVKDNFSLGIWFN